MERKVSRDIATSENRHRPTNKRRNTMCIKTLGKTIKPVMITVLLAMVAGTLAASATTIALDNIAEDGFSREGFTGNNEKTGQYGETAYFSRDDSATDYARWTADIPTAGLWGVEMWWPTENNTSWASGASVTVADAGGTTDVSVDQHSEGGQWKAVGIFDFNAASHSVTLNTPAGDGGYALADGLRFNDQLTELAYGYTAGGFAMSTSDGTKTNIVGATATFAPGSIVKTSQIAAATLEITASWWAASNRSDDTLVSIYDGEGGTLLDEFEWDQTTGSPKTFGEYTFATTQPYITFSDQGDDDDYFVAPDLTLDLTSYNIIPEPASALLLMLGGLALLRRPRR